MVKSYFVKHPKTDWPIKVAYISDKKIVKFSMKFDKNDENCMKSTANWNPNRFRVNHFNQMWNSNPRCITRR